MQVFALSVLSTSLTPAFLSFPMPRKEGIGYTVGRVPIASCDFSTSVYSYAPDDGDFELQNFTTSMEVANGKVNLVQKAIALSTKPQSRDKSQSLWLYASPWSAPAWMKTNGKMTGCGEKCTLKTGSFERTWAIYFKRFIDEYHEKYNVKISAVTVQNEPLAFSSGASWQNVSRVREVLRLSFALTGNRAFTQKL